MKNFGNISYRMPVTEITYRVTDLSKETPIITTRVKSLYGKKGLKTAQKAIESIEDGTVNVIKVNTTYVKYYMPIEDFIKIAEHE